MLPPARDTAHIAAHNMAMRMTARSRLGFIVGLCAGGVLVIFLNLLPYWRTYRVYQSDGYEVIGCPLAFRRLGGFSPHYEFSSAALLIDTAVGGAICLGTGLAGMTLMPRAGGRSKRGFPIGPDSGGR